MADKKLTAAEKKAAAEAAALVAAEKKAAERRRLIGAGALLAAVALFVGGYAVGNASDGDGTFAGSAAHADDDHPDRDGPRFGDRFPGPRGGFELPHRFDFDFPDDFDFPEGFEFPGPRGGFSFEFDFPDDFEFPEGFEFPRGPFGDEHDPPPPTDEARTEPGFLGVSVVETDQGVEVVQLFVGSAAAIAGLEVGDMIASIDGVSIGDVGDLVDAVSDAGAGTAVEVGVRRGDSDLEFELELGSRPS